MKMLGSVYRSTAPGIVRTLAAPVSGVRDAFLDVVSQINRHELADALDPTNREVSARFDFKGTNARVEQAELVRTLQAPPDFQVRQVLDIVQEKNGQTRG
ncbi:MAG: DUF520 family protein [Chromatiales bacterium]